MKVLKDQKTYEPILVLPEEQYICPVHGAYAGRPILMAFLGNIMHQPHCPACDAERAAEMERRDQKERTIAEEKKLAAMNIPKRDWDCSFDTFDAYTSELQKHLKTARNFAEKPEGKLVMLGGNGAGKNHLATAILRKTGGFMGTSYEISLSLRQSYSGNRKEWEVLQELCEKRALVIDEIGRTKDSDAELNWLSHVINKRHGAMLPTILLSNLHLRADCPNRQENGCPQCLENRIGNDVISRIIEDGVVMKFTCDDYRRRKRAEHFQNR